MCLLDPRQLGDSRYTDNENFRDQLAAADVIIANKEDTWQQSDRDALQHWHQQQGQGRRLLTASQGQVDTTVLDLPRDNHTALPDARHHHHDAPAKTGLAALKLTGHERWRRALNQGQGYYACGWIFDGETQFNTARLLDWVRLAPVSRVKGVMRIAEGTLVVNRQGFDLRIETQPASPPDSRIEIINDSEAEWNTLQKQLLDCRER
ncbi:hypothetical protein OS31_19770 [Dickeya oryzae]